jgi:polysaccharide chain length determinant protein (PEP-CTERM system associated)
MEEKSGAYQIDHFIELALRHRWFLIIPFCLSMVIGIILLFVLPKTYEASAFIMVRPQSVPTDMVQSIVTIDIESRIQSISRQILSRTNLKEIITQFNLFMEPEHEKLHIEDKISLLRDQVDISTQAYGESANMFSISFSGPNPEQVAPVVNGLAALFINENLRVREEQSLGTTAFLEAEIQPMRRQLENVEQKIQEFRNMHMGELPEQLGINLRTLDQLRVQLDKTKDSLRSTKDRLIILESQMKANQNIIIEPSDSTVVGEESSEVMSITLLKQQLESLQASYTDRHPDVIRLKNKIADLEAKLASGEYKMASPEIFKLSPGRENAAAARFYENIMQKQNQQMVRHAELKVKIKNLQLEIGEINVQIDEYQRRVENTPALEQELQSLNREYQEIKTSHNYLLSRKLEANISVNMEKKQKGEQFEILDRAFEPRTPISPNLIIVFLLTVFLGVHLGGGLVFLKDFFDNSLKSSEDIERDLGISVLATIPKIRSKKDLMKRVRRKVMTVCSLLIATCLFAGFAVLAFIGPETTIEIIRDPEPTMEMIREFFSDHIAYLTGVVNNIFF